MINGDAICFLLADGISIPTSYTSYLAPLSSARLHSEVAYCKDKDKVHVSVSMVTDEWVWFGQSFGRLAVMSARTQSTLNRFDCL